MRLEKILPFVLLIFANILFIIGETYGNVIDKGAQIVLSGIIIGSLFIWQLYFSKKYQSRKLIPSTVVLILSLIPASAILSSLFSISKYRSLLSAIFISTVFFAALVSSSDKVIKKYYPYFIIFIAGIFALYGIYDYVNQYPSLFTPHVLRAPWHNRYLATEFLLISLSISVSLYFESLHGKKRFMLGSICVALVIAVFLTQSWQPILTATILTVLTGYYLKIPPLKQKRYLHRELLSFAVIVLILVVYLFPQFGREIVSPDTLRRLAQLRLIDRIDLAYYIPLSLKEKLIYGFGPNTVELVITSFQRLPWTRSAVLHNQVATTLIEQGIIGFFALLVFTGYIIYLFVSTLQRSENYRLLGLFLAVLAFLLINSSFGLSSQSKSLTFIFWTLLGIAAMESKPGKQAASGRSARKVLGGGALILILSSTVVLFHIIRINKMRRTILNQDNIINSKLSTLPDIISFDPEYYLIAAAITKDLQRKKQLINQGQVVDPYNLQFRIETAAIQTTSFNTLLEKTIASYPYYSPQPYLWLAEKYAKDKDILRVKNILRRGTMNFPINNDYYSNKLLYNLSRDTRSVALLHLYLSELYPGKNFLFERGQQVDKTATFSAKFLRFKKLLVTDNPVNK